MADYLVLRLYGPLASWGEIAVGESRHSATHPSRSALLGLLGAVLGVAREDDAGQASLTAGYRFGVKLLAAGTPLSDYHTVQAPGQQRKSRYRTRRQELSGQGKVNTLLSAREYRCDSIAIVAVEALPDAAWSLDAVAHALRHPVFPPYLGRKSCPLGVPIVPYRATGVSLRQALDQAPQDSLCALIESDAQDGALKAWPTRDDRIAFRPGNPSYYWEVGMDAGMEETLRTMRHDAPLSRRRWQFAPREECVWLSDRDTP